VYNFSSSLNDQSGNKKYPNNMDANYMSLRFTARQLVSQSKRCEKEARKEKLKLKRAIEQGNTEGARIYAQNAIRQKNQVCFHNAGTF
jgi:hypothetical protein